MIDTGATSTVVRSDIIEKIGISPIGVIKINTLSSVGMECYQYQAAVVFPNNLAIETSDLIVAPLQGQHIQSYQRVLFVLLRSAENNIPDFVDLG